MAKDKKKKKSKSSAKAPGSKVGKRLKQLSNNQMVADVVAAALVATAAALKDSKKARALAASAGDELEQLAKQGAERGNAMWQLALDVGRRAVGTLAGEESKPAKAAKPGKAPAPAKTRSKTERPKAKVQKAPSKKRTSS